ncbi:protein BIC1-like isoform X3 [Panicum virgatum]|uniref:protein BIC1-like isoform X2 n=1 Tax=Panicum virgatum TaxID=38727 RepID=UPI0019D52A5A|nr:protein BIC1-like isoform X2 [Panicum virgatum]XP_039843610.1 protein BIC1-like isoform X3 [Panicum virgatum]
MAPSDSQPCTQQRPLPPAGELQQPAAAAVCDVAASDDRAPAAGTSESQKAPAEAAVASKALAAVEPEKKKQDRAAAGAEESARERLKRHRTEMAGRVRIPDMWGQERLLKDWVDCAVFDRPLAATTGLLTARDALVAECAAARRPAVVSHGPAGRTLRVQNGCS